MNELNRQRITYESEKDYKSRLTRFYKDERALLKEEPDLKLHSKPKDLAELIYNLHIKKQATYNAETGRVHCEAGRHRTENDLYLCLRHYHSKNIQFKFGSELLYTMMQDNLLRSHFCNVIHRHCYGPKNLSIPEEKFRTYLEEKDLNLKFK